MIEELGIGARVGDCVLVRQLGRGGMGAVYLARHVELGVEYALKVQHLRNARSSRERAERFRREAQALAKVDRHPGIVGIHQYGLVEGTDLAYCLLDLVEGQDLSEHLTQGGLPVAQVLTWGEQIARALTHVHAAGIVHRDLKPANVLVRDADQQALLTDFGLARDDAEREKLTATGQMIGTAFYMAPEQVTAQRDLIGPKSDVFSLGAVLYEMLTGAPPFAGGNLFELSAQIVNAEAEPIADVPPDLDQLVRTCLAKEPEQRPTAVEVSEGLARIGRAEPLGWSRRSSSLWRFQRAVRRGEPRAMAWALGASALVLVGLGVGAFQVFVARPAAAARATRSEFTAWRLAALEPCAFGLGDGAPPTAAAIERWIERLSAAGESTEALTELRAYARWLAHSAGRPVDLVGGSAPDRIVDGLILTERGYLSAARELLAESDLNASLPARLARRTVEARLAPSDYFDRLAPLSGRERVLVARQAPTAIRALWTAACSETTGTSPPSEATARTLRTAGSLADVGDEVAASAKRSALEARAPAWVTALDHGAEPERLLAHIATLAQVPPRVRPGPALEQVCLAALERLCVDCEERLARGDLAERTVRRLLTCERLLHYRIWPGRRLPKRLRRLLTERAFDQRNRDVSLDLILTCVRYGVPNPLKDIAKLVSDEEARQLRDTQGDDPGVQLLLLYRQLAARSLPPTRLTGLIDGLEASLNRDLTDHVAPEYVAGANHHLASRLLLLGKLQPARAAEAGRRAVAPARRYQAFAVQTIPNGEDDLLDSFHALAWSEAVQRTTPTERTRARLAVWEEATTAFTQRLRAPSAPRGRETLARFELGSVHHQVAEALFFLQRDAEARQRAALALEILGPGRNKRNLRDTLRRLLQRITARGQSD